MLSRLAKVWVQGPILWKSRSIDTALQIVFNDGILLCDTILSSLWPELHKDCIDNFVRFLCMSLSPVTWATRSLVSQDLPGSQKKASTAWPALANNQKRTLLWWPGASGSLAPFRVWLSRVLTSWLLLHHPEASGHCWLPWAPCLGLTEGDAQLPAHVVFVCPSRRWNEALWDYG